MKPYAMLRLSSARPALPAPVGAGLVGCGLLGCGLLAGALLACNAGPGHDEPSGSRGSTGDGASAGDGDGPRSSEGNPSVLPLDPAATSTGAGGPASCDELGYGVLPDGRGGLNYEQVCYTSDMGFDKELSRHAFETTVYPLLQANCSGCHSTLNTRASGAQAPIHSDADVSLAHEYALTRVNFRDPEESKLVVRMAIDRHNCFGDSCADAGSQMLAAVQAWRDQVAPMLPELSEASDASTTISEAEVLDWVARDRATLDAADQEYVKYTSLHELFNEGVSPQHLNVIRAGLSKALNSTARWAPAIVNPVDINGRGIVYRFDTRDYWGYGKGVQRLHFGGSDDDLAFGSGKQDAYGNPVDSSVQSQRYDFDDEVSFDPEFSLVIWDRVTRGNVEGAVTTGAIPPYIDGFEAEYVEASQLAYTLTRPDVYNAIMMIPFYAPELEDELGVIRDDGMQSYDYFVTYQAITIDSRLTWRARRKDGGFYWKTWDVFTGQLAQSQTIEDAYRNGEIRFPFWANPIPVFVSGTDPSTTAQSQSFIATLAQPFGTAPAGCDPQPNFGSDQFSNCRHFTGTGGLQQSASEIIWNLPNGLQGYALTGGFNQRRVDAFVNIVRDPRLLRNDRDAQITSQLGFATTDRRLNVGSSCIGCHADGMNRASDDLRDWLDENPARLPRGPYGVDAWIDDADTVARVRDLYPPTSELRALQERDRRTFIEAMTKIKRGMVRGVDKNLYVEPLIWTIEYAQNKYRYPQTRSN
jgi:hypothetical protein